MTESPLRDLIARRVDRQWSQFAAEHPHLAAAIDRVRLIEQTIELIDRDPRYLAAMRAGDLDDAQLARAAEALDRIEHLVDLALPH